MKIHKVKCAVCGRRNSIPEWMPKFENKEVRLYAAILLGKESSKYEKYQKKCFQQAVVLFDCVKEIGASVADKFQCDSMDYKLLHKVVELAGKKDCTHKTYMEILYME